MTTSIRPHTEYRDSGLPWLGKVPKHWEVHPAFACYAPRQVPNTGMMESKVLSLSYGRIVVKPPEKLHGLVPASFETYQIADEGDIIIRPTDLQNDHNSLRVGHVRERGIITSAYLCLRTKGPMTSEYGYRFLSVWDLTKAIYGYGSGLRQNLDFVHFKRLPVAVPPLAEQDAIVRFLRSLDNKVNRFVRNRRRLIDVLNEQKQAIINRAVTRGLDPSTPLKPSGIDWLGSIPAHWVIKPLKRWVSINERVLPETTDPEYAFDYLDIGCVGTGRLAAKPSRIRFGDSPSRARRVLQRGDTIISTVRTYLRAVYFVAQDVTDLVASTGFAALTPHEEVIPEYLGITLQSDPFINRVTANSIGIAYPAIAETRLGTLHVAIPPNNNEQQAIVDQVRSETAALTAWIEHTQREIDLIREYRTRLIADVVTGKVDVRGLAPTEPLPTEEQVDEGIDDEETLGDDEPEPVEEVADADE